MNDEDLLAIITYELDNSSTINGLDESLAAYLGNPDGKETEGRSEVISTDVADVIEWIMPQVMSMFTQNNELAAFDPVNEKDELQADLETQFVYDIVMKHNPGFVLLYEFIKDCLMQRNGLLKVYYENYKKAKTKTLTGITDEEVQVILAFSENVELISREKHKVMTEQGPLILNDIKIRFTKETRRACINSIPPEEFRYNSDHNSILLDTARFTAHVTTQTASQLLEMGVSKEVIDELPFSSSYPEKAARFNLQGESINPDTGNLDASQKIIDTAECYLLIDNNGDGISEPMKVLVAGGLFPTHILLKDEIDEYPWVSATAILMSHKFQGLSLYDRIIQIQEQKTALLRNIFDNIYFQNNQRIGVIEGQVNMDDVLVSRPSGIVRASHRDAMWPIETAQLGPAPFSLLEYLDMIRTGRAGVTPEGPANPQKIGDRLGSEGFERLLTAKEELVGLIIRLIGETGIKNLCIKVRNILVNHADTVHDYKFRGQWLQVKPQEWQERTVCTVRVGSGTGNVKNKLMGLQTVMGLQKEALVIPGQTVTDEGHFFGALDDYCKLTGLNGASKYFLDPVSKEGQQKQQQVGKQMQEQSQKQMQEQMAMLKVQTDLAQAEMGKAQAQMLNVKLKAQVEEKKLELANLKNLYETKFSDYESQLDAQKEFNAHLKAQGEMDFKYDNMANTTALELTRIEAEKDREQNANFVQNKETVNNDRADRKAN